MKSMSEEIKELDFQARRQAKETQQELDITSVNIVNRLFVFFESICRGFDKQYHSHPQSKLNLEKIQWARGFMDYGINRIEDIEFGIKKCRIESPINTPTLGQFLKWCKPSPEELGIPSLEYAYVEACNNSRPYVLQKKWTHQAIYHAWKMCNSYELTNLPKKNTFPIFERYYDLTVKMIIRGEPLHKIPIGLSHDRQKEKKPKIEKQFEICNSRALAMNSMRKILGNELSVTPKAT